MAQMRYYTIHDQAGNHIAWYGENPTGWVTFRSPSIRLCKASDRNRVFLAAHKEPQPDDELRRLENMMIWGLTYYDVRSYMEYGSFEVPPPYIEPPRCRNMMPLMKNYTKRQDYFCDWERWYMNGVIRWARPETWVDPRDRT